jgi:hypothetical protein
MNVSPEAVCYKGEGMTMRRTLLLALVLTLVLAPALAVAVSNCAGMGADCEGPCGTTAGVSTGIVLPSITLTSWSADVSVIPHAPVAPVRLIDLPPRP